MKTQSRPGKIKVSAISIFLLIIHLSWINPSGLIAQSASLVAFDAVELPSKILGSTQSLCVHVPIGYTGGDEKYPVIFVLDPEERFAHTVAALEHLSAPYNGSVPKAIVVGIASTDRYRDLTPSVSENWHVPDFINHHGGADTFVRYLADEVVPFIEHKYRAAGFRVLVGHSIGGLFALYVMATTPDLFRGYVVLDPSAFWNNGAVVDMMISKFTTHRQDSLRMFVADGLVPEGIQVQLEPNEERLLSFLKGLDSSKLFYTYKGLRGETHNEMPFVATYYGLKAIFSDYEPQLSWKLSLNQLDSYYENLSHQYGYTIRVPDRLKNRGGRN